MRNNYDDMLELPRHVSRVHPPMSIEERAAQFAPFAALTGHRELVKKVEGMEKGEELEVIEEMGEWVDEMDKIDGINEGCEMGKIGEIDEVRGAREDDDIM